MTWLKGKQVFTTGLDFKKKQYGNIQVATRLPYDILYQFSNEFTQSATPPYIRSKAVPNLRPNFYQICTGKLGHYYANKCPGPWSFQIIRSHEICHVRYLFQSTHLPTTTLLGISTTDEQHLRKEEIIIRKMLIHISHNCFVQRTFQDRSFGVHVRCYRVSVNSLWPRDEYVQLTWSSLIQIMAWRLIGVKPLSKPMLVYCELEP